MVLNTLSNDTKQEILSSSGFCEVLNAEDIIDARELFWETYEDSEGDLMVRFAEKVEDLKLSKGRYFASPITPMKGYFLTFITPKFTYIRLRNDGDKIHVFASERGCQFASK